MLNNLCLIIGLLFAQSLLGQCLLEVARNPSFNILGRTIDISNAKINGGNNIAYLPVDTDFNVSFDWKIGRKITSCPGCITFFYFGLSGTTTKGGPRGQSYDNSYCMGSVYRGANKNSRGKFRTPKTPGYYYISIKGTWTYWCYQYPSTHNCNNAIALVVVGEPQPFYSYISGVNFPQSCSSNDGEIVVEAINGSGCYKYNWAGPNGFKSKKASADNLSAGDYAITVIDAAGCDTVLYQSIGSKELSPSLDLGPDRTLPKNGGLTLSINRPNVNYRWNDQSNQSTKFITKAGVYWLEIDSAGCRSIDSVSISERITAPIQQEQLVAPVKVISKRYRVRGNVVLKIYDKSKEDGDIINLYIDDKLILENYVAKNQAKRLKVTVQNKKYIRIQNVHEGSIPPNTVVVEIREGGKVRKLDVETNVQQEYEIELYRQ